MCVYRTDEGVCKKFSVDGVTSYCVDGPCAEEVLTNADRIRSMTDEELAEWLCSLMTAECCDQRCPARDICGLGDNGLVKWMKHPAEED